MSFEEDLVDLFEYDDFDSYNEHTYQVVEVTNGSYNDGIPSSVELSETLNQSHFTVNEESPVKSPEIFLTIDVNATGASESFNQSNLKYCGKSNSLKSTESIDVILTDNQDECIELQYENEFIGSSEPDCNVFHSPRNIDNDYDELLFEGIIDRFVVYEN